MSIILPFTNCLNVILIYFCLGRDVGQLGMMVTLSAQMAADLLETLEVKFFLSGI